MLAQVPALEVARPRIGEDPDDRIRVMLLLGSLSGGGAERVAVNLINRCDPTRLDMRLGLLRRDGPYLAEVDKVLVASAPTRRGPLATALAGPAAIRAMVRAARPDVLMSFGPGVDLLTWLALATLGRDRPRWICREDSNPDAELANLGGGPLVRASARIARRHVHRTADGRVVVARDLAARAGWGHVPPSAAARVIHNPIDLARIEHLALRRPARNGARPYIVAAGRLVRQKGYDVLIDAFAASVAARDMDLVILGEGPLRAELAAHAARAGVADRVLLAGFQDNPWAWFARARLFVLSSRWEGFGNVVAEAMACGAPVLVTDCDFGPREQVAHGVSGWVVPPEDAAALAGGIDALLGDRRRAESLAAAGRLRARAFDAGVIAAAYSELFAEHGERRRRRLRAARDDGERFARPAWERRSAAGVLVD